MDIDSVKSEFVTKEFLAVVLAGFGNELVPLTNNYGDEPCPKCLLPIANKPLLEYVLTWLEQSGITDILLICPSKHRSSIYHHVHSDVSSSSLRIDLQTYDEFQGDHIGTCSLLRQFSNRISEDFVVVPCDFIPPHSLPLRLLLNKFRVDSLSEGSIATTCWFSSQLPDKGTFFEEWGPVPPISPVIYDSSTETLLHINTPDDLDKNSDEIQLKMSLLSRYPRLTVSASLEDSHVYVFRRSVLAFLHEKNDFSSLREEFLPWLCKIQYRRLKHSDGALSPSLVFQSGFKVGIVVHKRGSGLALRINTLHKFYEMNRQLLSAATYSLPFFPIDRSLIDQKAQISTDSIVGESTQISERSTIKKSVIGRHCVIGKMVKINGCVLLDHCTVEDGVKLDSCILGKSSRVGIRAELTRCITQAGYEVGAGEIAKGEKLEISNWMDIPDNFADPKLDS